MVSRGPFLNPSTSECLVRVVAVVAAAQAIEAALEAGAVVVVAVVVATTVLVVGEASIGFAG